MKISIVSPKTEVSVIKDFDRQSISMFLERIARVSHKSEDKITDTMGAIRFLEKVAVQLGHESILEHAWFYVTVMRAHPGVPDPLDLLRYYQDPSLKLFATFSSKNETQTTLVGNLRMWRHLSQLCDPRLHSLADVLGCRFPEIHSLLEPFRAKPPEIYKSILRGTVPTVSAHFRTSRAVGNQLVRHRFFAFTQESTRYNNYKTLEFIGPVKPTSYSALRKCASIYEANIANGMKPEDARDDLPLRLKTEIHMTLPAEGWINILNIRLSKETQGPTRDLLLPVGVAICKEFPELKNWLTLAALQRISEADKGDQT